jgi:hypothetical protein
MSHGDAGAGRPELVRPLIALEDEPMKLIKLQCCMASLVAGLFLHLLTATFARPNLFRFLGHGGGRIRIGESWFDITRKEAIGIVHELTAQEFVTIQEALAQGHAEIAQDLLAAAALRFFRKTGRPVTPGDNSRAGAL